ncbi:MAG: DUF309 domain-containing protein [Myxococcota bacterium]|nr:DUF309 domain-containing protein [Myxococcota bacterium]
MSTTIPAPHPPPPQRVADWDLPPYRFVPGVNPHPFRHPDGHMYTDGSAPTEAPWDPAVDWHADRLWLRGLDLFDHRYYWEAHECWEAIWHSVPREDPFFLLLQGLIQSAAYLLKTHMGHHEAAARLRLVSIEKLSEVLAAEDMPYRGVDLNHFIAQLNSFESSEAWPRLD